MAGDNDKNKKGFSGLSDLASEVSGIDEPIKPEPKAEAKPSTPKQPPQPQRDTTTSEPEQKSTSSPPPVETVNIGNDEGGSDGKWIFGIISVIFVIIVFWLINNVEQSNKKPSYTQPSSSQSYGSSKSTPAPVTQTQSNTQSAGLQYTKPSVGTNNVLSVPEIRWCIREGIRIEAMRDVIDNNAGIDEFNRIVNDYNSRCGSYRYREGSQSRAERDVKAYRSQIVSEAIRKARQLGRSYPSVSPGVSTSTAPKKPNAQYTREAQRLLTGLGYDPGPVDGDYGRRTAGAVKAFQRDAGITQDGWIDQDLISVLRRVANQRSNMAPPKVESRPAQESRRPSGIPANAHIDYTGRNWVCDSGYQQVGNECVKFKVPANASIDYTGRKWVCDSGYRQVGNECVKFEVPANASVDYTGRKWVCDSGYRPEGDKCVKFYVPQNASVDYTGRKWVCDSGYRPEGDKCVKFSVPANASVDYTGRKWVCDSGYRPEGDRCVKFFVPANASVDYTGRKWVCDRGYQRAGDKCVSIFGQ